MTEPNVKDMVKMYLRGHGYDGLWTDECGCHVDDLAPCDECLCHCQPGYIQKEKPPDAPYGYLAIGPKEGAR